MQWQPWTNTPNGWAYSQYKLQLASVTKGSNGHQMSTLTNKDPIQLQRASRNVATGSHYMHEQSRHVNCVSDPPTNAPWILYQPWKGEKNHEKKEHYQKVLTQGKAKEHEHSNRAKKKGACRGWLERDRCQGGTSSDGGGHEGKSSPARRWKKKKQETQAEQCPH